ncbi:MAG: hypothetical protein ACI9IP_003351 [Arcticibacterium sp.]|jgi:hypothetical protein
MIQLRQVTPNNLIVQKAPSLNRNGPNIILGFTKNILDFS